MSWPMLLGIGPGQSLNIFWTYYEWVIKQQGAVHQTSHEEKGHESQYKCVVQKANFQFRIIHDSTSAWSLYMTAAAVRLLSGSLCLSGGGFQKLGPGKWSEESTIISYTKTLLVPSSLSSPKSSFSKSNALITSNSAFIKADSKRWSGTRG